MQIQFLGGAQTVTGSQHLLKIGDKNVLLECGLFQGRRSETYERNLHFEFDPADIHCLVLSHAHIDHSGNIPNLYRQGFRGPIYATDATCDLANLMLRDSANLNERDADFVNNIRRSRGQEPIEPLYTMSDAEKALNLFKPRDYYNSFEIAPGVRVTFHDAGHILGSAAVLLEIEEAGNKIRLGFSGDVGKHDVPILRDPDPLTDLDYLIMESTYGDRVHEDDQLAAGEFAEIINLVYKRGGKLIIPAFAVGRTQLLLYMLHRLQEEKRIPKVPIYVDSPMACSATEIFKEHPEAYDVEAAHHYLNDDLHPLNPDGFACTRSVDESKAINLIDDPMVIIAASGMMEGGRVLHHLRNNIEDPKDMLLFVGFAAKHTLARRLMDGDKRVKIFGEEYPVKLETRRMPYFSAHADGPGLIAFLGATPAKRLKGLFLVHGEKEQAMALKRSIEEEGYKNIHVPPRLETHGIT